MFIFCCYTFLVQLAKKYYLNCLSSTIAEIPDTDLHENLGDFFPPYQRQRKFTFLHKIETKAQASHQIKNLKLSLYGSVCGVDLLMETGRDGDVRV
jgi:hypothetical protein